jgi:hypothetical protein
MYKANQIAWLRAGTNGAFGQMVTAIEGMKVRTNIAIDANRHILTKLDKGILKAKEKKDTGLIDTIERKKEQLVRNFHIVWLEMLMFEYINKQGNFCWLLEDVSPPLTVAIQSNQPIQLSYPGSTLDKPKGYGNNQQNETQKWGEPKNDE